MTPGELPRHDNIGEFWVAAGVSSFATLAFYFSPNATLHDLDYTSRIASALLHGDLGLRETPPDWRNEMVPQENRYYSAFPLFRQGRKYKVAAWVRTGFLPLEPLKRFPQICAFAIFLQWSIWSRRAK